jgi:lipooligosaccharide transport system permease protein
MHATPLRPADIALGQLGWIATRISLVGTIFVVVMVLFGAARSPLVALAIPVATLTGMAFAGPIAAFAATQDRMDKFNAIFRFGITPLFLFSGTFFPIEQLPAFVQPLAWVTPLWHGVSLARGLALGTITDEPLLALVHLAVLLLFAGGGIAAALWTFRRRLVK